MNVGHGKSMKTLRAHTLRGATIVNNNDVNDCTWQRKKKQLIIDCREKILPVK